VPKADATDKAIIRGMRFILIIIIFYKIEKADILHTTQELS
jgi:hypothetical protein